MKAYFATCLGVLLFSGPAGHAEAQSDTERLRPQWQALDADGDGSVALAEIEASMRNFMRLSDHDSDGMLSLQEYVSFDLDPGSGGRVPLPTTVKLVTDLPYAGTRDARQQVDVYVPRQRSIEGPLPVIAYIHGGAWRMGSRVMARRHVAPHVASGRYAAVSLGYRLSWQESWPAQIHDVKAGIRWIRAHAEEYGFDPERICAMGSSAGGHLTAEVGTTNGVQTLEGTLGPHTDHSSDVQCAIDFYGPTDLTSFEHRQTDLTRSALLTLLGGRPEEMPERAREASPVYQVDPEDPPFLIIHGTRDPLVPYAASVDLAEALREAGVPVVLQKIDGGGHGDFFGPEIVRRVQVFLDRTFYDQSLIVPDAPIVFPPTELTKESGPNRED